MAEKASASTFSVVNFLEDNSVEVIPSKWIISDGACKFPDPQSKGLGKILRNADKDPLESWQTYNIKCIKSYDTFERAQTKADNFINCIDIESSEAEGTPRSRRYKTVKKTRKVPEPHTTLFGDTHIDDTTPAVIPPQTEASSDQASELNNVQSDIQIPLTFFADERIGELQDEFRNFQEISLTNQETLLQEIVELKTLLLRVLKSSKESPINAGIQWPLKTMDEYEEAQCKLADVSERMKEVSMLSKIGGSSKSKIIYNTLRLMIGHDLSTKIRFTNKTGKLPFANTSMCTLVKDAVKEGNPDKGFTDKEIEDFISSWFRQSVDRVKINPRKKNGVSEENSKEKDPEIRGAGAEEDSDKQ